MGKKERKMRAFLALLVIVAAASAQTERELVIHAVGRAPDGQIREAEIVIAVAPRAPFPQRQNVPPAKLAVMGMLANCKGDAFAHCGAKPMVPICPKRLAMCLAEPPLRRGDGQCEAPSRYELGDSS